VAEKTYTPTDGMASAARRALKWKEEGKRGGTTVGLARANQLVKKESLSQSTVLRMHSFFSRHEVDKKATGFNSGEEGFPSPGRVAWDLWGGDSGASWSKQKRDQIMNDRMNKSIWSGVFFPTNEPQEMALIAEDPEDAPLDVEVVDTNFQVERESITENDSITNEVTETPNINDESNTQIQNVDTGTSDTLELSDDAIDSDPVIEQPEVNEQ
jgi:hypothetical protein